MLKAEWFNLKNENDFNKYYPIVYQWWIDWKWSPIDPKMLPQNGVIIKDLETDQYICAAWGYMTDSSMFFIDFVISTKSIKTKRLRKEAFKLLGTTLINIGKKLKFEEIVICAKSKEFVSNFIKDCNITAQNMNIFIKNI